MVNTNIGICISPSYAIGKCTAIDNVLFENISIDADQSLLILPNWGSDIDDPAIQKVSRLTFRKIDAVSDKANLIVFPIKKGMFENISIADSTFTLRPDAADPGRKHWTQAGFGIICQLGGEDLSITNCKGFSENNTPLLLKRNR